jgi:hypothetical protein
LAFIIIIRECYALYILLSVILQIGGLVCLLAGIVIAAVAAEKEERDSLDGDKREGNFDFWYQ